jgi:hypothetical protein
VSPITYLKLNNALPSVAEVESSNDSINDASPDERSDVDPRKPTPHKLVTSYHSQPSSSEPSPAPVSPTTFLKLKNAFSSVTSASFPNACSDDESVREQLSVVPHNPIPHKPGMRYNAYALNDKERERLRSGDDVQMWTKEDLLRKNPGGSDNLKEKWWEDEDEECKREEEWLKEEEEERKREGEWWDGLMARDATRKAKSKPSTRPASLDIKNMRTKRAMSPLSNLTLSAKGHQRKPSPLREPYAPEKPRANPGKTFDDYLLPAPTAGEPDAYTLAGAEEE